MRNRGEVLPAHLGSLNQPTMDDFPKVLRSLFCYQILPLSDRDMWTTCIGLLYYYIDGVDSARSNPKSLDSSFSAPPIRLPRRTNCVSKSQKTEACDKWMEGQERKKRWVRDATTKEDGSGNLRCDDRWGLRRRTETGKLAQNKRAEAMRRWDGRAEIGRDRGMKGEE